MLQSITVITEGILLNSFINKDNNSSGNNSSNNNHKSNNVNTSDADFDEWLNSGEKDTVVYKGIDRTTGKESYTGITKQPLDKRKYQHNYPGKDGVPKHDFEDLIQYFDDKFTRNQARALEQYYIEKGPANEENIRNSISPESQYYNQALKWASEYIQNQGR